MNSILIEAITASAMAFLIFVRIASSIKFKGNYAVSLFFIIIFIGVGTITYQDLKGVFPIVAAVLGTISYFHLTQIKMRLTFAAASSAWVIHNVMAGSISATIGELIGVILHLTSSP